MAARHSTARAVWSWIGIVVFSLAAALIGTLLHRAGADRSIPWGMMLALLLVFATACWARHAHGTIGLAANLLLSTSLIWMVASNYGPGGDILVPISSTAFVTFWSRYAGYIWILGATIVQLLALALPKKWFERPPARQDRQPRAAQGPRTARKPRVAQDVHETTGTRGAR